MTIVVSSISELSSSIADYYGFLGFVPTMGALHQGHLSLVERAKANHDFVVVSIFVNPLQFGVNEDYIVYPRSLATDLGLCEQVGVDVLFAPVVAEIYGGEEVTQVFPPASMTQVLCGRLRQGHFTGVATVITKLLNIVRPHSAYFGQKDAQQVAIIKRVVRDLNLPVHIVSCATVRSPSGLALSSRNQYLSQAELDLASNLYGALRAGKELFDAGVSHCDQILAAVRYSLEPWQQLIALEYIELVDLENLQSVTMITEPAMVAIAAKIGMTRLIDNIILSFSN